MDEKPNQRNLLSRHLVEMLELIEIAESVRLRLRVAVAVCTESCRALQETAFQAQSGSSPTHS